MEKMCIRDSQYDKQAEVLGSFTHSWTQIANVGWWLYTSKEIIDLLNVYSRVEGDFQWGLAYHPRRGDIPRAGGYLYRPGRPPVYPGFRQQPRGGTEPGVCAGSRSAHAGRRRRGTCLLYTSMYRGTQERQRTTHRG